MNKQITRQQTYRISNHPPVPSLPKQNITSDDIQLNQSFIINQFNLLNLLREYTHGSKAGEIRT